MIFLQFWLKIINDIKATLCKKDSVAAHQHIGVDVLRQDNLSVGYVTDRQIYVIFCRCQNEKDLLALNLEIFSNLYEFFCLGSLKIKVFYDLDLVVLHLIGQS